MNRHERGSASVGLAALGILAVGAVGVAWMLSRPAPNVAGGSGATVAQVDEVRGDVDRLEKQIGRLERTVEQQMEMSMAMRWPDEEGAAMAQSDMAGSGDPVTGEPGAGDPAGGRDGGGRGGRAGFAAGFEDMRRLRDMEDPAEKLALALEILDGDNPFMAGEAISVLLELDPAQGVRAIQDMVANAGDDRRAGMMAARMVAELGDLEGYDATGDLVKLYQTGTDDVRMAAARALEKQGDASLISAEISRWTAGLTSNDPGDRVDAIRNIGNTRSNSAVVTLVPMLADADSEVRIRALDAISRTGTERDIASIEALLNDPVAAVRDRAVRTIQSLREPQRDQGGRGGMDFGGGRGGRGGRGG